MHRSEEKLKEINDEVEQLRAEKEAIIHLREKAQELEKDKRMVAAKIDAIQQVYLYLHLLCYSKISQSLH